MQNPIIFLIGINMYVFSDIFVTLLEIFVINMLVPFINYYNLKNKIRLEIKYIKIEDENNEEEQNILEENEINDKIVNEVVDKLEEEKCNKNEVNYINCECNKKPFYIENGLD